MRIECTEALVEIDFPGYAVGGLSVGELPEEMYRILDATVPALPGDKPRYLMGVGRPQDILEAIASWHRLVRLRAADSQRPQRDGVHRRWHVAAAKPSLCRRPAAAGGRLPVPRVPPQPRILAALVHGRRNAGSDFAHAHNLTYYQRLLAEARRGD